MKEKLQIVKTFIEVRWLRKFKNRKQLEKYQNKKVLKQLKYLKKHSSYFKDIDLSDGMNSFYKLPYMNKEIMMHNFDSMNTVDIKKDKAMDIAINGEKTRDFSEKYNNISVGLSSGTSGHRGLFIISDKERSVWAGGVMAKLLPKNNLFGHKVAFFLRADNNLYETANTKIMEFKYFDILKNMDENIEKLDKFKPTILVAPPSVLLLLAQAVEDKKLNINPVKIISVAEVLSKKDEEYFKKVFKQDMIFQVYQCTEGFLAYTCECGSFHINEDVILMEKEYIDDKRFVPIITDYIRTSQPIIRYRLNDILVESKKKCKCGSKLMVIDKIEGREDDIFLFDSTDEKEVIVFPDFISRCIIYVPDIKEYKVVQNSKSKITVYLDNINEDIKEKVINEFKRLSKKMNFKMPKIVFENYKINLSRKLKRVERSF